MSQRMAIFDSELNLFRFAYSYETPTLSIDFQKYKVLLEKELSKHSALLSDERDSIQSQCILAALQ